MYEREKAKIKALIPEGLDEALEKYGGIIAGGTITSVFCNREVNDLDIYFSCEEDLFRTVAAIYNMDGYTEVEIESYSILVTEVTQRSIFCHKGDQMIQLMCFKYFPNIEDIFKSFDFTCCMGAYDAKNDSIVLHPDFLKHNSQRYLKFNDGTDFPIMSLLRVKKYEDKGYTISKSEYLRVLFTCMNSRITSWEEARDHIGGMYGMDMSKAFNEATAFSMEELVNQLGNISDVGKDLYTTKTSCPNTEWEDLCKEVFYHEEDDLTPREHVPDDSQYYYKCVDSNFMSKWAGGGGSPIKYEEGMYINLANHYNGIFAHYSSSKPWQTTDYWVELKVCGGGHEFNDHLIKGKLHREYSRCGVFITQLDDNKLMIKGSGTLQVTKCFTRSSDNSAGNRVKKYIRGKYLLPST